MKKNLLISLIIAASVLPAAHRACADLVNVNSVDARIQGGTLANTANLAAANAIVYQTVSYYGVEIKSGSSLGSGSRKSYFQFNVGANVNTNANAFFTLQFPIMAPPSQAQRVQLWALNQAYAGFSPATVTWNNAQANATNDLSLLLTDPTNTYTAALLASVLVPTADSTHTTYTFTLPGGASSNNWGNYLKGGAVTLALTGIPDATYNGGSPVRSITNSSFLSFNTPIGSSPMPSISACTNVSTYWTLNSPTNYFTVSGTSLNLPPMATSDNQAVVADADIHINGSGASWNIYVVGGLTAGTANITMVITDSAGNPANANFKVTVNPVVPVVSNPADTNTLTGIAVTVPFTVYEPLSNANNVTIWATSLNTNLVPDANLVVTKTDGGGTNRTIKVTPLAGTNGIAPIALWASDGVNSNRIAFAVQVRPSAKVVFFDAFAYTTNLTSGGNATFTNDVGRLDLGSGSFWKVRGGTSPAIFVPSGQAQVASYTAATPQSLIAPLVGGPYLTGHDAIIYTSFKATWTALPSDSGTMVSLYDPNSSGTVGLVARVVTVITNASTPVASGFFRVGVGNGEGTAGTTNYIDFPQDLSVGTTYTVATRYVVDAAKTTLWINPANENSPSVIATDVHTARSIYDIGLRQGTDTGPVLIDDLKVTVVTRPSFVSVTPSVSNVVIVFAAGLNDAPSDFIVKGMAGFPTALAPLNGPIISLGGGLFQATEPAAGQQGYYQLERQQMVFP